MKTTVRISDSLVAEARELASREGTTLKALVEEGLRRIITERKRKSSFRLRKVTFNGEGLQTDLVEASWEQIRELTYEGRGG